MGAGALGAVFLTYLYPLRLIPPRLIATDIAHAIPLAVIAGIGPVSYTHLDVYKRQVQPRVDQLGQITQPLRIQVGEVDEVGTLHG